MSSLEERMKVCSDESLQGRVAQALLEVGKVGSVSMIVAGLVAASQSENLAKSMGPGISDEEILAAVTGLT